jgi:hypothetical protein
LVAVEVGVKRAAEKISGEQVGHVVADNRGQVVMESRVQVPSNTFAIFYDDLGQSIPDPGLVRLGTVDTRTDRIAEASSRFTVQIYLTDHVRF